MTVDEYISRWTRSNASERANFQSFLSELCDVLGVERPDPAAGNPATDRYVFEYPVTFRDRGQRVSSGFVDLYKAGHFVLEAKQSRVDRDEPGDEAAAVGASGRGSRTGSAKARGGRTGTAKAGTAGWDVAMERAYNQALDYARALPTDHGWPPFIVVLDVGHMIELYSDFTGQGRNYQPFPDPRTSRIGMDDLRRPEVRERLRLLFADPLALDPSRVTAKVTAEVAQRLATLARSLEGQHAPNTVAAFLMRCLFAMFSEDAGLLPEKAFEKLLDSAVEEPLLFVPMCQQLFHDMDVGGFSAVLRTHVRKFNGGLFADRKALELSVAQIEELREAARADWRLVEPAIFGTLLERALDPKERHKLGAHYTPRAYVERLVVPTVMEPLRAEWDAVRATVQRSRDVGKPEVGVAEVRRFHQRLCKVRVLDPACGSGNFLYVTLELMKRLEGEVLRMLHDLDTAQAALELEGFTVNPQQFLGIEVNPRAAQLAELVLWIGYLQWQLRTGGAQAVPDPVLRNFGNIECRDAVLAWDRIEARLDEQGRPVTRWDGVTTKTHPVTGEQVPDELAVVQVWDYLKPRAAEWPQVDFIVGNPPFLGTKRMRAALGDGYVDALRATYAQRVQDNADFVMYWWDVAAEALISKTLSRFGLITTNSLHQIFNRRVVERAMVSGVSLAYAIPDHPWVDTASGAAVRIAMTIAELNGSGGVVDTVVSEAYSSPSEVEVRLRRQQGLLVTSDLKVGASPASAKSLAANAGVCGLGVALHGAGFVVDPELATLHQEEVSNGVLRRYIGGRDLSRVPRSRYVIDFSFMTEEQARLKSPWAYQHVYDYVRPERLENRRDAIRINWWRFGWERPTLRKALAGLDRFIVTTETTKHRFFQFLGAEVLPDHAVVCMASPHSEFLAVLSSRIHVLWSLSAGGRLGVGNDPRYNKTRCFDPFPFPELPEERRQRLREVGEQLEAHRRMRQAAHPDLTLTDTYNVLEKLRDPAQPALTAKERVIHEKGLVSVLKQIHDEIDAEVAAAYGWPGDLDDEGILERLVALNAERAAEEAAGHVRYLRPEFQDPNFNRATQADLDIEDDEGPGDAPVEAAAKPAPAAGTRLQWPKAMPDQAAALLRLLAEYPGASAPTIAAMFKGVKLPTIEGWIETLQVMGR